MCGANSANVFPISFKRLRGRGVNLRRGAEGGGHGEREEGEQGGEGNFGKERENGIGLMCIWIIENVCDSAVRTVNYLFTFGRGTCEVGPRLMLHLTFV